MGIRFLRREHIPETDIAPDGLRTVRAVLDHAQRVLVLTGAGISASAGLPTFRGRGGLYTGPVGVPDFMRADVLPAGLEKLWEFWGPLRTRVRSAEPTAAHRTLASWQQHRVAVGAETTLVTCNVDDLHERAGSPVHHLHGSLFTTTCLTPSCAGRIDDDTRSDGAADPCPACGGRTRPGMVMFGEAVDIDALWAAKRMVRQCDAFVAIGTSGAVSPASGWVRYARDVGAVSVAVNPAADIGADFDHHVRLEADIALPLLMGDTNPARERSQLSR